MPIYASDGVKHLWLVDPDLQTLEVYALNEENHWTLLTTLKNDDPVRQPPFNGFEFSLGVLWG
jgi:Uma2 family endonuclease